MKLYVKPEAEEISLIAEEEVTSLVDNNGDGLIDGDLGLGSSLFPDEEEEDY